MTTHDYAPGVSPAELRTLWALSFEKTTRGIAIIEPSTRNLVAVNPAYAAMHGGEVSDLTGKPLDGSLPAAGAERLPALARKLNETGFLALEADHLRLDGSVFRVAAEVMAANDEDGNLLYRICWFDDLSERHQLERRSRQVERQFEAAFSQAAIGMAMVDLDGHWLRANAAFCELIGYTERELSELNFAEVTHPDDLAANFEGDERLLEGEATDYQLEKRYIRKDGEPVWVLLSVALDRDDDGTPNHYIVHAHDISLRKRIEADLAQATVGPELGRDLMCAIGGDDRLADLDGRWSDVLGWSEEELTGLSLFEFVHPDDRNEVDKELARIRARGGSTGFRCRWRTSEGHWAWLLWSLPGLGEDGRVFCSAREADERVGIEEALELRGEVIANMTEGVCLITVADMRVVYANPSLERMLGYQPGEMTGSEAAALMRPTDLSAEEEAARAEAESTLRAEGGSTYEGRRLRKDGTEIWCRTTTSRLEHPRHGEVWIAVHQDITEERRTRAATAELERAKSEFLGSVSHELRTPLTSILGYAALLRADAGDPPGPQLDHIEVIERNAARQLRLVEDLLSIARIEAGEFEFRHLPFDLAELVAVEAEAMRPDAESAALTLEVAANGPLAVMGDGDRLAQVIVNLLSNAIKFTPPQGRIEVGVRTAAGEALITVDDSGPGLDAAETPQLFERLFRGEDVRERQISGAGLGLAISRSIVEAHSGRIEARKSELGGACFEVALPALGAPRRR